MLFAERANEFEQTTSLSPYGVEAKGNLVLIARLVVCSGPEARRACHDQGEFRRNAEGGPNP